jgi:hypothetical protein
MYSFGCGTERFPKRQRESNSQPCHGETFKPPAPFGKDSENKWSNRIKCKFTSGFGGGFRGDLVLYTEGVDPEQFTSDKKKFPFGSRTDRFADPQPPSVECPAYYYDIGFVKKTFNKKYI